jgi:hypothetical protein
VGSGFCDELITLSDVISGVWRACVRALLIVLSRNLGPSWAVVLHKKCIVGIGQMKFHLTTDHRRISYKSFICVITSMVIRNAGVF